MTIRITILAENFKSCIQLVFSRFCSLSGSFGGSLCCPGVSSYYIIAAAAAVVVVLLLLMLFDKTGKQSEPAHLRQGNVVR